MKSGSPDRRNEGRYGLNMRLSTWSRRRWIVPLLGAAALALVVLLAWTWDWPAGIWRWLAKDESGSTTIRNMGLVIGAVVALWLTLRRIAVADRQAETAEQGLLYDRYQKGAEMLGSTVLAVRLGGIYALNRLATEHPEAFLPQIVGQYCAFVRHPPESEESKAAGGNHASKAGSESLREDVRAVMNAIGGLMTHEETFGLAPWLLLDLRSADLSGADLSGFQLSRANLSDADLSGADLSSAGLEEANIASASLRNANLSGTRFSGEPFTPGVRGLTQDQLDEACADRRHPPKLEGVVDRHGTPLQWRGKPCKKRRRG